MARWKLGASTTFEILPRSTCTLCKQKSYISKDIQPIFEIFASARRCSGWAFGWKVSGAQVFYFCNGKVKTCRIDNIWNFATFNLYTVPAKILYLQRYSIDFRNLCLSSKMLTMVIWVESFRGAGILLLQWQSENFAHRQYLKFCHFQAAHCASKNPISPKVFNWFLKSFPQLEDVDGGHLGEKIQVRRYFAFAVARWKLGASTTFEILPRPTCILSQQKSYISKCIQPIFEIFASSRRCWQWPFGWKVSGAQVFCFWNGKVKTWRIDNNWNFATFNLYTVPAKILYLQRYSGDFRNLGLISKMWTVAIWLKSFRCARIFLRQWEGERFCIEYFWNFATFNLYTVPTKIIYLQRFSTDFRNLPRSSTMLRVGICVESFRCAAVLLLQWQTENFAHRQHLKFSHFQPVHCASKNPISRKVFRRFSKSSPHLEDVDGGHLVEKFQVRTHFTSAMARWTFVHRQHLKFCYFQPVHCASRNPISPKIYNQFSKSSRQLEDVQGGHLVEKFQVRTYFTSAMARWTFVHRQHLKFCYFQPVHCASRNPISPKIFNQFSKSSRQLDDVEGGHFCGKFQVSSCFTFAMANWKLCASTTFEILPLSTCTLCQQKSYISKGIQPIFEIFAPARRCWRWPFGCEVSRAQVFYFCNGKVKTLRIDNILNFATFNLYTVQAEILYLQRYSTNFRNLRVSSKMLRVGIWAESFRCAGILLLQWQGENLAPRQHLKFCHVQPVHCASKNPISPKVFNRFSKSLPHLEDVDDGHLGGKFQVRMYFAFAMARWKLGASTIFEIFPLSTCTLCQQKSYTRKVFRRFSKSSPHLEDVDGGHLVEKFQVRTHFTSAMARWTFVHRQHLKFCYFQPVHCASRNPISPKIYNQFSKSSRQLEDVEGGHLVEKFQVRTYFTSAMARWTFVHRTDLKFCYFQPVHCASKNHISPKVFNRFSKSLEYLWRYRIFAGTVYRLNVAKFQMLSRRQVLTLPLQK